MKILINKYHPVSFDICLALQLLGHEVTLSINTLVKDHYGSWKDLLVVSKEKYKDKFEVISVHEAIVHLRNKKYDLVGVDGVFDSDEILMEVCKTNKIPYFCVQGYPGKYDEPSNNILSLGWSLPTVQYLQNYPSEGHRKDVDWMNIVIKRQSEGKNVMVFYPCFFELKQNLPKERWDHPEYFVSGIHRYQECNRWCFGAFKEVEKHVNVVNFDSKSHDEFIQELKRSKGLLMLKAQDQPGISLFEAMLLSKTVFTMKSYVLASNNQEVLIDDFNAVVADNLDELIDRMKNITDAQLYRLGNNAYLHAEMLTRFERQKNKLQAFLENCIK